ncbi:MAG TPA: glycosyltransferase family 1 protein [Thermoanaerobaculia bacterium]|nr:glycosyltransferase family 1 protein [Thermoanaerobaculia bacterium]
MKLGINAVRLTRPFTGVGRFAECVLEEWSRMKLPFERVILYSPAPIDPARVIFPLDAFETRVGGPSVPDPLWENAYLPGRAAEVDIFFSPSYTLPLRYPGKCAVMNLGPSENRPLTYEWFRSRAYERLYRASARRADRVFACSKAVKLRIVQSYGIPPERVSVAWLAPSRLFIPIGDPQILEAARRRYSGSDGPFILFVGKLARRHSIPNLVAAFARLRRKGAPHRLVLAGPDYLGLNVAGIAAREGVGDAVVHHDFVEHRDLPALYSAAEVFVFPATAAEGFGIPVVEAMACGTPVVSVSQGSIPEFASGAAHLVATSSVEDLASGLEKLIGDSGLRRSLREKGLARAAGITWRVTAERILSDLEAVANQR